MIEKLVWKGQGFCYFCNEECNPCSQAHSGCSKNEFQRQLRGE